MNGTVEFVAPEIPAGFAEPTIRYNAGSLSEDGIASVWVYDILSDAVQLRHDTIFRGQRLTVIADPIYVFPNTGSEWLESKVRESRVAARALLESAAKKV